MQDKVTQSVADEIFRRIDQIGEAISQGAVAGWDILITQQIVRGSGFLLLALALIAINVAMYIVATRRVKTNRALLEDPEWKEVADDIYTKDYGYRRRTLSGDFQHEIITSTAFRWVSFGFGLTAIWPLYAALARFINPGYYAIKEVIGIFG